MEPNKLEENWRNADGTLKAGHPNLGAGRPKGKTIKERIREIFDNNPEKFEELVDYYIEDKQQRALLWQMLEGKPAQSTDITSKGEKIMVMPSELIGKNDSPPKSIGNS